jgi:hypothetical protein
MAVQIVYGKRRGARRMEHVGFAHDERYYELAAVPACGDSATETRLVVRPAPLVVVSSCGR